MKSFGIGQCKVGFNDLIMISRPRLSRICISFSKTEKNLKLVTHVLFS